MQFVLVASLVVSLAAALATPALAQKQEREGASGNLPEIGKGSRMGRQELKPGAYITPRHRQAVRAWYVQHKTCLPGATLRNNDCVGDAPAGWKIGVPLPGTVPVMPLPVTLAGALPPPPPGNEYVVTSGDILLIASQSRIVVDAVPASR